MNITLEQALRALTESIQLPVFSGRHVPINKVSEILGKNQQAIRIGLQRGILPIGVAIPTTEDKGKQKFTYYVSPKLLWEYTGVIVEGQEEGELDEQ